MSHPAAGAREEHKDGGPALGPDQVHLHHITMTSALGPDQVHLHHITMTSAMAVTSMQQRLSAPLVCRQVNGGEDVHKASPFP